MTTATATKSKAPASAETWSAWLEQFDALQEERAGITGMGEALERLEAARRRIQHLAGKAWNNTAFPADLSNAATRGDEDAQNVRALVRGEDGDHADAADHLRELMARARRSLDWAKQSQERRTFTAELSGDLREASEILEDARDEVATLEQARSEVDQRIEDHQKSAPKASASTLATLRKERDAAAEELDRIAAAIDNMSADDSPLALAREAEQAAGERLEEAEALLAMGETGTDEVKSAQTAAKKARQALEEQQGENRRQEAARRGLARKREQAESRLATTDRAYRQALGRVSHDDLAARESTLVEKVEALAEELAGLNRVYADLEEAEADASYGAALLEVKFPTLHHHPRRDLLSGARHTLTAAGFEE